MHLPGLSETADDARMDSALPSFAHPRMLRAICVGFALSSFALGGWMLVDPSAFWRSMGLETSPFVASLYAGGIVGEGVMFALTARRPLRYLVFFEYMVVYKTLACLAFTRVLSAQEIVPPGAFAVLFGWAVAGATSAWIAWEDPTRCSSPASRV